MSLDRKRKPKKENSNESTAVVQRFNEALNLDRDEKLRRLIETKEVSRDYLLRRHKFKFLTKAENRSPSAQKHIERISKLNPKIAQMEMIKEHFHQLFESQNDLEAKRMFDDCVRWAFESKARCLLQWLKSIRKDGKILEFLYPQTDQRCRRRNELSYQGLKVARLRLSRHGLFYSQNPSKSRLPKLSILLTYV